MALGKGKQRLCVVLKDEQIEWIRGIAEESDSTISQVIRAAVNIMRAQSKYIPPEPKEEFDPFGEHDALIERRLKDEC